MTHTDVDKVRVMIRCPVSGDPTPTGMVADPNTWDARPIGLNRVSCPVCKQTHAWSKKDAFLERPGGSV